MKSYRENGLVNDTDNLNAFLELVQVHLGLTVLYQGADVLKKQSDPRRVTNS